MEVKDIDREIVKIFDNNGEVVYPDVFLKNIDHKDSEIQQRITEHIECGYIGYTDKWMIDSCGGQSKNIYQFVR